MNQIRIIDKEERRISDKMFGLFLEDINFSCDGGLNANVISNNSFDGVYTTYYDDDTHTGVHGEVVVDRLRYWDVSGRVASEGEDKRFENSWYVRTSGNCVLKNLGYNGNEKQAKSCAVSIIEGHTYDFSCWLKNDGFDGKVCVYVEDADGTPITCRKELSPKGDWQKYGLTLCGKATKYGRFVIEFEGVGDCLLDFVVFRDSDAFGDEAFGDVRLRRDLVESLRALSPKFMRFPGGCIVEGSAMGNEYRWKDTIGQVENRKAQPNLWGQRVHDGGYMQSYQVGFYELFLLCEALKMEPLPVVWAGLYCQFRSKELLAPDSAEFEKQVIDNALDLIDYANGDPNKSVWAAKRRDAGHPKPFNLKMIGIGNENWGDEFLERFDVVKKAVNAKYPEIEIIYSAGPFSDGPEFEKLWKAADEKYRDVIADEHGYHTPEWWEDRIGWYDSYDRTSAKVFLGEYAANGGGEPMTPNIFKSALYEAAFLTHIEKSCDVVVMTSYAPLFSLVDGDQWNHNMINYNPKNVLLTANYFVQKLYFTNVGKYLVDISGELPKRVYASATADENKIYMKIVNLNEEKRELLIEVAGVSDKATVTEFYAKDLEARNELTFEGEPQYNVVPKTETVSIQGGLKLAMKEHSFCVLVFDKQ